MVIVKSLLKNFKNYTERLPLQKKREKKYSKLWNLGKNSYTIGGRPLEFPVLNDLLTSFSRKCHIHIGLLKELHKYKDKNVIWLE